MEEKVLNTLVGMVFFCSIGYTFIKKKDNPVSISISNKRGYNVEKYLVLLLWRLLVLQ